MVALFKCAQCDRYTLKTVCPSCGRPSARAGPAKYSPEDAYGEYRRKLKRLAADGRTR